jgi:hypothetical protein
MRRLLVPVAFLPLLLVPAAEPAALTGTVVEFKYNGSDGTDGTPQTFVVPPGVTRITINAWGAAGSRNAYRSPGGLGARARASLRVAPGEVLTIRVGGRPPFNNVAASGGYNGGGGGAGAPASHRGQSRAVLYTGGVGGDSGGIGGDGGVIGTLYDPSRGGEPGLADSGGLGNYSGAGGGGWYGGGAGASGGCEWGPNDDYVGGAGGGGGGSSLVPAGGTVTEAVRVRHGAVVIRY